MYLVKDNDTLLASCESHDMAFTFFMAYGGFEAPSLHIEKEA